MILTLASLFTLLLGPSLSNQVSQQAETRQDGGCLLDGNNYLLNRPTAVFITASFPLADTFTREGIAEDARLANESIAHSEQFARVAASERLGSAILTECPARARYKYVEPASSRKINLTLPTPDGWMGVVVLCPKREALFLPGLVSDEKLLTALTCSTQTKN